MNLVTQIFAMIAVLFHLVAFILESFLFHRPDVQTFLLGKPEPAPGVRLWAFNQGFYNLFLAAGPVAGLVSYYAGHESVGRALVIYGCAFMAGCGVVLFISTTNGSSLERAPWCPVSLGFAVLGYRRDGTLDATFGTDGFATALPAPGGAALQALSVPPDGKIIAVGGGTDAAGNATFIAARFTPSGTLDSTFNGVGTRIIDTPEGDAIANAVALQPDGRIVLSGTAQISNGANNVFARLNPDGSNDTDFGDAGLMLVQTMPDQDLGGMSAVAVKPDGKIVATGLGGTDVNFRGQFATIRLLPDGSPDTSFGNGQGFVTTMVGEDSVARALMLLNNADAIAAGAGGPAGGSAFAVANYRVDGSLNEQFGSGGIVQTPIGAIAGITDAGLHEDTSWWLRVLARQPRQCLEIERLPAESRARRPTQARQRSGMPWKIGSRRPRPDDEARLTALAAATSPAPPVSPGLSADDRATPAAWAFPPRFQRRTQNIPLPSAPGATHVRTIASRTGEKGMPLHNRRPTQACRWSGRSRPEPPIRSRGTSFQRGASMGSNRRTRATFDDLDHHIAVASAVGGALTGVWGAPILRWQRVDVSAVGRMSPLVARGLPWTLIFVHRFTIGSAGFTTSPR